MNRITFLSTVVTVLTCIVGTGFSYVLNKRVPAQAGDVIYGCTIPVVVAITFDDGPWHYTPEILDVLKEKNVTTTFFVNGGIWLGLDETAQMYIRRSISEGHTIGSHTWEHRDLAELDTEEIREAMTRLSDALLDLELLDAPPTFMRPPYGSYNDEAIRVIQGELNYTMVNWNIDSNDWQHPGDTEAGLEEYIQALNGTNPTTTLGFITLHHDVQRGAAELASAAIDYVRSQGYRLVSLEECLGLTNGRKN